ncbi:MAG: hypothetical protein NWF10_04875 [Candidatus Bathyarchaeota archaeon]|nr:hypothetical protein [Candidatus Bathyarchaeota archaeon]
MIDELTEILNTKNWSEIVFCGFGEPTQKLDLLLEVTKWIKRHYGKPVLCRVNTNGQAYALNPGRGVVKELKKAGINKVSVVLMQVIKKYIEEFVNQGLIMHTM